MMLHLVRRDHGPRVANQVAQRLVVPPHRLGDQAQFVARPVPLDEAARLARLMDTVRARPADDWTLATMADRAAMSVRTLQRQFQQSLGVSPVDWLVRERVEVARQLLETSGRAGDPRGIARGLRLGRVVPPALPAGDGRESDGLSTPVRRGGLTRQSVVPPDTSITAPLMYDASSEASHA